MVHGEEMRSVGTLLGIGEGDRITAEILTVADLSLMVMSFSEFRPKNSDDQLSKAPGFRTTPPNLLSRINCTNEAPRQKGNIQ